MNTKIYELTDADGNLYSTRHMTPAQFASANSLTAGTGLHWRPFTTTARTLPNYQQVLTNLRDKHNALNTNAAINLEMAQRLRAPHGTYSPEQWQFLNWVYDTFHALYDIEGTDFPLTGEALQVAFDKVTALPCEDWDADLERRTLSH